LLHVGERAGTVMLAVAVFDVPPESVASYVKLSLPLKPFTEVYVTVPAR
jgi:hypothetical protein